MSSSFKTVAAFVGGLVLGAGALTVSNPEERRTPNPYAADPALNPEPGLPQEEPVEGLLPADGAAGPPPPDGTPLLPPDGAGQVLPAGMTPGEGLPPGEVPPGEVPPGEVPPDGAGEVFTSQGKAARPVAGVLLLDEHLNTAEARWWEVRGKVKGASGGAELLQRIDALVMDIPEGDGHMPPLQDVVRFLVQEKLLLDDLTEAGVDVAAANAAMDKLLAPPQGKVKGGHEKAFVPGGAGQAPDGTRPLDPDTPRRALESG